MRTIEFIKEVLQSLIRGVSKLAGATSYWVQKPKNVSGRNLGWIPDSTTEPTDTARPRFIYPRQPVSDRIITTPPRRPSLWVGLPPRSDIPHARRTREYISNNTKAKDLIRQIAKKLNVNEDKWVLLVFSDENPPHVLDNELRVAEFLTKRTERLYFYPKTMVR